MIPRLYSGSFDSVRQAEGWGRPADRRHLVGALRLTCLVAQALVLTDTQLLDGTMLLDLGPTGVRDVLGGDPEVAGVDRVVVAARRPTVGESLLALLEDPRSDRVRPFRFSALGLDEGGHATLSAGLSEASYAALVAAARERGAAAAVADLLRASGAPADAAERQRLRWQRWVEADELGHLVVEPWGDPPDWQALLREAPYEHLVGLSHEEKALVRPWRERGFDRSAFYAWTAGPDVPEASRHRLRAWYDDVYHRGAARQHGAGYIALVGGNPDPGGAVVEDEVARLRASRTAAGRVVLPAELLSGLGALPGATFDTARFAARDGVQRWLAGDVRGMRAVAYAVEAALEQPDPRAARREAVVVLALGALAALLAVAVLVLGLAGEAAVTLGLAGAAAGFLGSGLRDLAVLRRTAGGRLAALVDVSGVPRG